MNPLRLLRLVYHIPGNPQRFEVCLATDRVARPVAFAREIGFYVQLEHDEWHVHVVPTKWIVIDELSMQLKIPTKGAQSIFLNGYQSDTNSGETPLHGRTPGLSWYAKRLFGNEAATRAGDYHFVKQDSSAGHQHGFSYGYIRRDPQYTLFGSLNEEKGFTVIRQQGELDNFLFEKEPPAAALQPDVDHDLMAVCLITGKRSNVMRRWVKRSKHTIFSADPLIGYTTSYDGVMYPTKVSEEQRLAQADEKTVRSQLRAYRELLRGLHLRGLSKLFQIGEGYCVPGDWLDVSKKRFPCGLAQAVQTIHEQHMLAGLWLAPFASARDSRLALEHPDWLLRDIAQKPQCVSLHHNGLFALDVCNAEVKQYIAHVVKVATQQWGFDFLTIDYIYAAALLEHAGHNRAELLDMILTIVRDAAGPDVLLNFGGAPLASAIGHAQYCEISAGSAVAWDSARFGHVKTRERKSTQQAIQAITARGALDGWAFGANPGVMLFDTIASFDDANRASYIDAFIAQSSALLIAGNLERWTDKQKEAYRLSLKQFALRHGIRVEGVEAR